MSNAYLLFASHYCQHCNEQLNCSFPPSACPAAKNYRDDDRNQKCKNSIGGKMWPPFTTNHAIVGGEQKGKRCCCDQRRANPTGDQHANCNRHRNQAEKRKSNVENEHCSVLQGNNVRVVRAAKPVCRRMTERGKILNPEYNTNRDQPTTGASPLRVNALLPCVARVEPGRAPSLRGILHEENAIQFSINLE